MSNTVIDETYTPRKLVQLAGSIPAGSNKIGRIDFASEKMPIAIPKTPLQVELKYYDSYPTPTSIGSDGAVYGRLGGAKTGTIFRSADAFAAAPTEGYSFASEESPKAVLFVTKLGSKYVVITTDTTAKTASIWTSDSLTTGFTRAVNMTGAYVGIMGISLYHGTLSRNKIMLVCEYDQTGTQKNLHATFNGGVTWSVIKQTTVVSSAVNSHFHHATYDAYRGRIWVSQGDGVNARLSYSDDLGITWVDVAVPANSYGVSRYQPTLMIPMPTKICMTPDTDNIVPSVLSIPVDNDFVTVSGEEFGLNLEHSVWGGDYCYNQYGSAPYAISNSEVYLVFSNYNNKKHHFIVATGDGGMTWHNVLTVNFNTTSGAFSQGIVGPDSNGFLYAQYIDASANPYVMKATKISWLYK